MIRHTLLTAAIATAVLTLGACSSTSGTATEESPVSSSQSSTADAPAADTADAPAADAAEDAATDDSGSGDSSTAATVDGELDAPSAAWFGTVCDGVTPTIEAVFGSMGAMMGSGGTGDDAAAAKQAQAALADSYTKAADAMSAAAGELSALPPPTVQHGDEIAAEAAAAFAKTGPALQQIAGTLGSATVTSMSDLSNVMQQASDSLDDSIGDLSLSNFELSDALLAEVAKLPSCAPLMSLGALGGGDTGTATPTG